MRGTLSSMNWSALSSCTHLQSTALPALRRAPQQRLRSRRVSAARQAHEHAQPCEALHAQARRAAASAVALSTAVLLGFGQPALAEIQTVPPSQVTSLARPLPQQPVRKGRVWLLFVAGAASLFAGTVALESFTTLFPAIARANRAMAQGRQVEEGEASSANTESQPAEAEQQGQAQQGSDEEQQRLEAAVLMGLADARAKAGVSLAGEDEAAGERTRGTAAGEQPSNAERGLANPVNGSTVPPVLTAEPAADQPSRSSESSHSADSAGPGSQVEESSKDGYAVVSDFSSVAGEAITVGSRAAPANGTRGKGE